MLYDIFRNLPIYYKPTYSCLLTINYFLAKKTKKKKPLECIVDEHFNGTI